jgi:hypothetical protein
MLPGTSQSCVFTMNWLGGGRAAKARKLNVCGGFALGR